MSRREDQLARMSRLREDRTARMSRLREDRTARMSRLREDQAARMSRLREDQLARMSRCGDRAVRWAGPWAARALASSRQMAEPGWAAGGGFE
jgi:hypothetical protein